MIQKAPIYYGWHKKNANSLNAPPSIIKDIIALDLHTAFAYSFNNGPNVFRMYAHQQQIPFTYDVMHSVEDSWCGLYYNCKMYVNSAFSSLTKVETIYPQVIKHDYDMYLKGVGHYAILQTTNTLIFSFPAHILKP